MGHHHHHHHHGLHHIGGRHSHLEEALVGAAVYGATRYVQNRSEEKGHPVHNAQAKAIGAGLAGAFLTHKVKRR